jgi:hypothetical protein
MPKYLILGDGFVAKELFFFLRKKHFVILKKIKRPIKSANIKNFYRYQIISLLNNFKEGNIINCSASINPKSYEDLYFNSYFDSEFQKLLRKTSFNIKYINIGSTVIFSDSKSDYSISKAINYKKINNNKNFITIIPDLILGKKNNTTKAIHKIIKNPFIFFLILPDIGKIFYPIKINNLLEFIEKISLKNHIIFYKFFLLGKKKSFNELFINEINNIGIKKIIININLRIILNFIPLFIKNYMNSHRLLNVLIDSSDINLAIRKERNIKIINKLYENYNF